MKSPVEVFYSVTTGPEHRRRLLTPVGLLVFTALLLLPVFLSLLSDRVLGLPRLLPGAPGWAVGVPLLTAGGLLWGGCVVLFWKARGTPVPFNPPRELVVRMPGCATRCSLEFSLAYLGLGFASTPSRWSWSGHRCSSSQTRSS
jgi:hypothetical protein